MKQLASLLCLTLFACGGSQANVSQVADPGMTMPSEPAVVERGDVATVRGNPVTLMGPALEVGAAMPDFVLTANDMSDLAGDAYRGKILVLSVVPSLDTPTCSTQTRTFNQRVSTMSEEVVILTVSMDLPFAQKRFCGAHGIDRVVTASDYKHRDFGERFGVKIKETGLLARAVFVVGRDGNVTYSEYVPEISEEPNYEAALSAVQAAL